MASCYEGFNVSFRSASRLDLQDGVFSAKLALEALEVPVGCVILEEGNIVASGRNRTNETSNVIFINFHLFLSMKRPQDMQRWKQSMNLLDNGKKIDFDLYKSLRISRNAFFTYKGSILCMREEAQRGKGYKCRGIMADEAVSLFKCFYERQSIHKHTSVQNACIDDIYDEKKDDKLNKGNRGGRIHIEAKDNRKREDFRSSGHPAPPHNYFPLTFSQVLLLSLSY
ncbi:hypothetical protein HID58_074063 [Brassica napus]|uniref:CMP/dCMP-type deaminase domain-containing protein n=1 Tax=Brassica napus TaxID=3708 RepID=A0ABQ7YIN1_BRANA|nr:hypothetical protein HID58_074063 [Brassica napus]